MMKKKFILLAVAIFSIPLFSQIGINTNSPKATFDLNSKTTDGSRAEGFIAPRLTGDQIKTADSQYTADQLGTLIFATTAVSNIIPGSKTENITSAGYYFFDGSKWLRVSGLGSATYNGSNSISLNGNSFERAALTGDVIAVANSNITTVMKLQGTAVSSTSPINGQVLQYNSTTSQWESKTPNSDATVHNVTTSRSGNVTYTNNAGRLIFVNFMGRSNTTGATYINAYVDGEKMNSYGNTSGQPNTEYGMMFPVPAGGTYRVESVGTNLINWFETY